METKLGRNEKGQFVKGYNGRLGKINSKEHRKKISEAHLKSGLIPPSRKEIKHTEEHKLLLSKIAKERGFGKWMLGRANPKLAEIAKQRTGARNNMWQGGISFKPYTIDWTETLKRAIRERDKYICQLCSQYGNA